MVVDKGPRLECEQNKVLTVQQNVKAETQH